MSSARRRSALALSDLLEIAEAVREMGPIMRSNPVNKLMAFMGYTVVPQDGLEQSTQ